ncbi:MAG: glutamate mutase L [Candidatus Cloacimonadaceae bacterium]|nr:glutamate mutase L [Candidatus Cloacimonadaceae bacterium]
MRSTMPFLVLSDIGSTTTKAILLDTRGTIPKLIGLSHAATTVEYPLSDVRYGIIEALKNLEQQTGNKLLRDGVLAPELAFAEDVSYLTTSSAGGGLQILVIGLTLFDSASSAKRAAYGAGGVILDTFAVDDKRQAMEQMLAMRNLHPDMILLCGGTDGGAVSGVLRLAEIVRIAAPEPKFDAAGKIPAIYAGNRDAASLIEKLIRQDFDLHILPNLRPDMEMENLEPTQDKIQQLFMENVMEHAPGYTNLLPLVASQIIPTPVGVQNALSLAAGKEKLNIFAFDIGGATTDVFSYINTHIQRTVSANLGMSYSALNVLKECGAENLMRWLPNDIDESDLRNYIANKTINPTSNPRTSNEYRIEHALAREALAMALVQHRQMHYNTGKLGYMDKLKNAEYDKYEMIFEYMREERKYVFSHSGVDVLMGAGGIFAHAQNHAQCALILIDSFRPKGITEIWIDRRFISPHLGVLSEVDPTAASHLMARDCIEKLALHIAPVFSPKQKKAVMRISISETGKCTKLEVKADEFHYFHAGEKSIQIELLNQASIGKTEKRTGFSTFLPLIIDTRLDPSKRRNEAETKLKAYETDGIEAMESPLSLIKPLLKDEEWIRRVKLPYKGEINVSVGDKVSPDDVVAVNRFNPPRLYILDAILQYRLESFDIRRSVIKQVGDSLDFDEVYAIIPDDVKLSLHMRHSRKLHCPVRGKIEFLDESTGIMVLSEIQDYSGKPMNIDLAEKLMLEPRRAARYAVKNIGDFVYRNDVLAKRVERSSSSTMPAFVRAPITGTITKLDRATGQMTIQYLHKPLEFQAHVSGTVLSAKPGEELSISYSGKRLEGKIGFGKVCHGSLKLIRTSEELCVADIRDKILALSFSPDSRHLADIAKAGGRGVICSMIQASQLVRFLSFEPGVINTGFESIPLSIMLLEGFGDQPMPQTWIDIFSGFQSCFLDPHTRIRAGVVRPFICFY